MHFFAGDRPQMRSIFSTKASAYFYSAAMKAQYSKITTIIVKLINESSSINEKPNKIWMMIRYVYKNMETSSTIHNNS
jgi:hypothetical protein